MRGQPACLYLAIKARPADPGTVDQISDPGKPVRASATAPWPVALVGSGFRIEAGQFCVRQFGISYASGCGHGREICAHVGRQLLQLA
jgi:hypothetical protein